MIGLLECDKYVHLTTFQVLILSVALPDVDVWDQPKELREISIRRARLVVANSAWFLPEVCFFLTHPLCNCQPWPPVVCFHLQLRSERAHLFIYSLFKRFQKNFSLNKPNVLPLPTEPYAASVMSCNVQHSLFSLSEDLQRSAVHLQACGLSAR